MTKMNIMDLANLVTLARKGLSVLSESLDTESAKVAWNAISNAESIIKEYQENNKPQNYQNSENVEDTNVDVVTLNENDDIKEDKKED